VSLRDIRNRNCDLTSGEQESISQGARYDTLLATILCDVEEGDLALVGVSGRDGAGVPGHGDLFADCPYCACGRRGDGRVEDDEGGCLGNGEQTCGGDECRSEGEHY